MAKVRQYLHSWFFFLYVFVFFFFFFAERLKGNRQRWGSKPKIVVNGASDDGGINESSSSMADSVISSVRFCDTPRESGSRNSECFDTRPRSVKIGGQENMEPPKPLPAPPLPPSNQPASNSVKKVNDHHEDDEDDMPKRTWREFFDTIYEENFIVPCHGDFGVSNGAQKSMTLKDMPGFEGFHPRCRVIVYWKFLLSCE
jgi:hypothetical protein